MEIIIIERGHFIVSPAMGVLTRVEEMYEARDEIVKNQWVQT